MQKDCIDCGDTYQYDPDRALGASADRCAKCRKRRTLLNKRIELLNIASGSNPQCRKCGHRNPLALMLVDGIAKLFPANTEELRRERAKSQFILCLNCNAELEGYEVEVKVINAKVTPIDVEFYSRHVQVVKARIQPAIHYGSDSSEVEISDGGEAARPVGAPKRFIGERTIDVPSE